MQSHELRERFLAFFKHRAHPVVPSDALIPSGDPTVLFTSAGMNQFKDSFLGTRTDLSRAASCQKCLRTGDLEQVGKSAHHHTFFEMLGNFSFGDYFKREAIQWAWEFLTGTLEFAGTRPSRTPELCVNLPGKRLWVSVYEEDEETAKLWKELGVPKERIRRFGQHDNFWPANAPKDGPNGPCGPCSEMYFDVDGQVQGPNSVEVWNLVFTQFDRQPDGSLKPLPRPNIDTGMGLERLARVLQNVETDYQTDLFAPIMQQISRLPHLAGISGERIQFVERTVADHLRAIVFLIAEGLLHSNESRGYVLRMLIRRAHRLGRTLLSPPAGRPQGFLSGLAGAVEEAMRGSPYEKELAQKHDVVRRAIEQEEAQFIETLQVGTARLDEVMQKAGKTRVISGEEAFKLYDTYGFPLELTIDIAQEQGVTVDRAGFEKALGVQQARSRAASQFGQGIFIPTTLRMDEDVKVEFIGYQALEADTVIKGIWKQGAWATAAREGEEVGIILERSPCYGESGGQIGDRGAIECPHGRLDVLDTKWAGTLLVHHAKVQQGTVAVEEPVRATVDAQRRLQVARSHTAAHLLHWALRKVLGPDTMQAGSLVEVERVRFDFSALGGLRDEQRAQVEWLVNTRILLGDPVNTTVMNVEEAKRAGALALFGEKYGRQVRVVSIGEYSKELCGGTHVAQTNLVGAFRITAESSIAARTRRVEAVVGESAMARQQQESQLLKRIAERLSRSPQDALGGIEELLEQLRTSEKQAKALKLELAQHRAKQLVVDAKSVNGAKVVIARFDGADRELLSALADAIQGQLTAGVTLLVSVEAPASVAWVMAVTSNLVKRGLHAGRLLKAIAAITQGGGGGRAEFAQAGGKDASRVTEALQEAERLLQDALGR